MKLNAGIITPKLAETKAFYTEKLGFGVTFENEFYLLLHTPNGESEISFLLPKHPSQQALFQAPFQNQGVYLTIEVDDVDSIYLQLKKQGVEIKIDIRNESWGDRHFAIQDPNGIGIDFVNYTPQEKITEQAEIQANKVTWFSMPADNVQRAIKFYKEAFNWTIEPETKEENDRYSFYVAINSKSDSNYISETKGAINGCIVKREIGLPTPAVLVEVDDLDSAIAKVKTAGGKLASEKTVMKSLNGIFVLIKDTEGNYVELFQNNKQ
ncbi:MAG: Lactoylglutathione lyase-like protein [Cytophagaceae bacterium]|jgi:predicted enzyme related to lactoylglutathione lyase|nr:Lactoylglutathione lyase-like protein [Cytophagaceae bacterium]